MNRLFTPVSIGGMTLKNRIVMAPTSMMLPVEEKISFLGRVADGGAALIYIGDMGVEPAFSPGGINLLTEEGLEGCRRVIERLHRGGAKAGAQLYLWDYDLPRLRRMAEAGASREEIRREKNKDPNAYIGSLSEARIEAIIRSFAQAAQTARQVGFDLVQLLGGNLLNSFSSGYINRRTDTFGGSVEKRTALPCAVVRAVRQAVGGDFPVEYKLAVHDDAIPCGQGGPDVGEIGVFVRALEQAGVDAFMVALSNRADINDTVPPRNHPIFREEGCFLYVSDEVKRHTTLPVSCAGKISSPAFAQTLIDTGRLDYIAMSRQLVADPYWVQKVASGREDTIRRCLFCNAGCLKSLLGGQPFHCVLDRQPHETPSSPHR